MTLIDTNVVVYAAGVDGDVARQTVAIEALRRQRATGALSTQVLAEFASVLLRKGRPADTVRQDVTVLGSAWRVFTLDGATVALALTGVSEHRLSFWDAMLWATAKRNGCSAILSEDGPTGSTVGGVLYESPFQH